MRMHRKANLDERLVACSNILTLADLTNRNMSEAVKSICYLDLKQIFQNENPCELEIGCGKGRFVIELAKRNPNKNFIAVEKMSNVVITACEEVIAQNLKNVYFLNSAAELLPKYFKPNTFSTIYLNFSNPLPKLGYAKQRLTHPKFLEMYKQLLLDGGSIIQKTDNEAFFDFSLESYRQCGFSLCEICRDITKIELPTNIVTEHEQLFMSRGLPIFRVVATK